MINNIDVAAVAAAFGIATPVIVWLAKRFLSARDRRMVHQWMREHTIDQPGESHLSTIAIAKALGFTEERTRAACMTDKRIFVAPGEPELWSVWRPELRSVYEKYQAIILG